MTTTVRSESQPLGRPEPRHQRYAGSATTVADRFVWHPVAVEPPTPDPHALARRHVLVIGGSAAARTSVGSALAVRDAVVTVLGSDADPADVEEAAQADVRAAVRSSGPVDGIVDLGIEGPFAPQQHQAWRAALTRSVAVVREVYDDWAAEEDAQRCFYLAVTWMGGRMGYDRRGVQQPLGGLWAGLAKSLPHELPTCRVKVLDLGASDEPHLGSLVARELEVFDYYEVGHAAGVRYTLGAATAPCPAPRLRLAPDDVVLVSGGGRGVGFAFARELARTVGCRVVVTGRSVLRDEPWLTMGPEEHAELQQQRLREAGPSRLGEVRRENQRRDALRELHANLAAAARSDLPLEYRPCDFLDAEAVRSLVEDLGDRLRVVVHNAGIAAPTRLRNKPTETAVRVVESKLVPFVNLVEALQGRPVDYFCNVGSVAGRMGGMVGQIDYAAANEVLSRLGFWAQERLSLPVATLCWTTWEQIGLIANYEAALRYGAAMSVEEGVRHWVDELLGAEPTEAMFLGRIGTALSPTQIRGFLKFGDHPDLPWLMSRQHQLGDVEAYRPFRMVRSRVEVPVGTHPCLSDVTLDGTPILPVSVALEHAVAVGEWVAPEGWPLMHLHELRSVRVDLQALRLAGGTALRKEGVGSWQANEWIVHVCIGGAAGERVLECDLVYRDEAAPAQPGPSLPQDVAPLASAPAAGLAWRGVVYRMSSWCGAGGTVTTLVQPAPDSDAWALPYPPLAVLPSAAVERVVHGTAMATGRLGAGVLHLASMEWTPTGAGEHRVSGRPQDGAWWVTDAAGMVLLRCRDVVLR